jgi:hypothetical protein
MAKRKEQDHGVKRISFGRRKFSFSYGRAVLKSTSVTERALIGENEQSFTERLLRIYGDQQGTIEMVFKNGRPDYAILTFRQDQSPTA